MIEPEAPPENGTKEQATVVFLSLFLILFAFFLLLNSIAKFEETRAGLALQSLSETFAPKGHDAPRPDWLNSIEGRFIGPEEIRDKVATLIKTAFPMAKADVVLPGSTLPIVRPTENLFGPDGTTLRPEAEALFAQVARLLARNPPDYRYGADVIVGEPEPPETPVQTRAVARAGALARALTQAGAAPTEIAAGIDRRAPKDTRLVFRIRLRGEPRVDFHQLAQ